MTMSQLVWMGVDTEGEGNILNKRSPGQLCQ